MLSDFQELVDDLVRDAAQWVTPAQRTRAIGLALVRYSADRPREVVEDVVAADGNTLPLPAEWAAGESALRGIETPVGADALPAEAWRVYRAPLGEEIRVAAPLAAGQVVRLTYSAPHRLTDSTSTIPPAHREAVACYAASLLAEQIATVHAGTSDSTIAADRVDHTHPAREWARRAKDYRNRYFATLGIEISAQGVEKPSMDAAGVVVDLELPTLHGRGRLYRRQGR
jgi:hypothetical protein